MSTAPDAHSEAAGARHHASGTEGVRAFRSWVQQAGIARYSAEMASHYTELEIDRFTSMLRARLSVLTDMEMVLYLALLLGPQVMAACLHEVLQQRACTALRVGQRFPPDLPHALPLLRLRSRAECASFVCPAVSARRSAHTSYCLWSTPLRTCPATAGYGRPAALQIHLYPNRRQPTALLWRQTLSCLTDARSTYSPHLAIDGARGT